MKLIMIVNDQGGGTIGFSDEVTGTLRSQMGGHPPLVLIDEDEDTD